MSQTTRNSLSSLQLFRNSSDIPLSLTDRKQSISDKPLQWKNSDAQNVLMKGPSGKKEKKHQNEELSNSTLDIIYK